jgi:hypothetical protein
MSRYQMREALRLRDILPVLFACLVLVLLDAPLIAQLVSGHKHTHTQKPGEPNGRCALCWFKYTHMAQRPDPDPQLPNHPDPS